MEYDKEYYHESVMIGKKIEEIEVDGYDVYIKTEGDFELYYSASDGGCSSYEVVRFVGKEN